MPRSDPVEQPPLTSPSFDTSTWASTTSPKPGLDTLAASTGLPKLVYLDFRHNKASDPTPQLITERNTNHGASYPTLGRELQARHGKRAWLSEAPTFHRPSVALY